MKKSEGYKDVSQTVTARNINFNNLSQTVTENNKVKKVGLDGLQIASAETLVPKKQSRNNIVYIWVFGVLFLGAIVSVAYLARDPFDDWEFEEEK